ncbi:uncharacterized protein EV422DRAFT_528602 [Fimicolochytrium jonesii]|uniref:uncharacterized protein n=1 Tax=Fimicolochytrium jonesii TaxID=1396493 RepID=UPI0022FDF779|nr:uncharacterized protein EV422DRAFT_528602 [Fimicolochytrium jonesii]KAI8820972.1 hypothetical protein EV422DRAFT_528602 [Fimicolochytrium jonesii]
MSAIHCFFCGGKDCKWENWKPWAEKTKTNAVDGLYSNWITGRILAMQRPSSRLIAEYALTQKFQELGIASIFNLEEFGEHASCGDGIEVASGFSYLPEAWMDAGGTYISSFARVVSGIEAEVPMIRFPTVFYYNFGWQDMNVPDFSHMLSIAQVMAHALEEGQKIAVHCHAGLGRTGLAIACYLVYGENMDSNTAIELVRTQRPLSVQTRKQALFVHQFEEYVKPFKVYFPGICSRSPTEYSSVDLLTLEMVLQNQRRYFHGSQQRVMRFVPKIVKTIVDRLTTPPSDSADPAQREEFGARIAAAIAGYEGVASVTEPLISLLAEVNAGHWDVITKHNDDVLLVQLLLYWVTSLKDPLIPNDLVAAIQTLSNPQDILALFDKSLLATISYLLKPLRQPTLPSTLITTSLQTLATLTTAHRTTIKRPYRPQLLYSNGVTPPLPVVQPQWRAWAPHSRSNSTKADGARARSSSRGRDESPTPRTPKMGTAGVLGSQTPETGRASPVPTTTSPTEAPPTTTITTDEIPLIVTVLHYMLQNPTTDPTSPINRTTKPDDEPEPTIELAKRGFSTLSQLSLSAIPNPSKTASIIFPDTPPPPLPFRPPTTPSEPLPSTPSHPTTYWACILVLLDTLIDAHLFTPEQGSELRKLAMLKSDALEIAYEAYGRGDEVGGERDGGQELGERYGRFVRAVGALRGIAGEG